jgi:hypothetical protein
VHLIISALAFGRGSVVDHSVAVFLFQPGRYSLASIETSIRTAGRNQEWSKEDSSEGIGAATGHGLLVSG